MSSSWKDLPAETLNQILGYLPSIIEDKNIFQCAIVCKSWKAAVNHRLYTEVLIHSISSLSKFNKTIVENVDIANKVKKVKLSMLIDECIPEQSGLLYTILSNLPNLHYFT